MASDFLDRLDGLRQDAERSMVEQLGGHTACTLHRDGRVTGGLKYAEGRLVALENLARQVRTGEAMANIAALIDTERSSWTEHRDAYRLRTPPATPWLAYSQGGIDACTDALALLESQ